MKKLANVIAAIALIGTPVLAADLNKPVYKAPPPAPPAPVYSWTGWYVGINGGWGWASGCCTYGANGTIFDTVNGATVNTSGSINGGLFGGQIGANYQINALVLGIEGDWDWSGQSRTDSPCIIAACANNAATVSETVKIPWIATVRGRFGYAADRVLFYGTGGVAFISTSDNITGTTFGFSGTFFNASTTSTGWTAGAGVEWAFAQNWTAKVEYLYVAANVSSQTGAVPVIGGTLTESGNIHDSLIRAGINFKYP